MSVFRRPVSQAQQQTIEQQLARLIAHAQLQGWAIPADHIFRDDGFSGAALARPGLDRLRDMVARRELDRVLITAPDRLARNYVQQMVLLEEFARHGCQVDFLDRPMSEDPHDQLLLQIRGAVAEYERTLIAERMRRGRLSKLQAGLLLPWTRPPYGYRLCPDRPRDPSGVRLDLAEAAVVAEIFALYLQPALSLAGVAKALQQRGIPTPSGKRRWSGPTIRGILRNPTYTGQVYAQRTRYRPPQIRRSATHPLGRPHGTATPQPSENWIAVGPVPAIVSQEQFDQVQAKLAQNQSFASRNNTAHQYLLRALVSCGRCQLACTARTVNRRNHYYLCNGKGQAVPGSFHHPRRGDELDGVGGSCGICPEGGGDVGDAGASEQGDDEVEAGGADLGRGAGARLTGVLPEGLVPHPVALVLDPPVAANLVSERAGVGTGGRLARDVIGDRMRVVRHDAARTHDHALPFDATELGERRPRPSDLAAAAQICIQRRVGERPEHAHLQPAMPPLRLALRAGLHASTARRQISHQPGRSRRRSPAVRPRPLPEGKTPPPPR